MKYWVYKDARIHGPFDRDAMAGLPGFDAGTLVCAGDASGAAGGDWRPAGEIGELSAVALEGASWSTEPPVSSLGGLDGLRLETAGLVEDGDFPGALAEDLFQDADLKRAAGDLLHARPGADEAELRRARDRAAELAVQMESLYKRIAELEAGQTELMRRLAEREMELRRRPTEPMSPTLEAFLRATAAPPPAPVTPSSVSVPPPQVAAPPAAAPVVPPPAVPPVAPSPAEAAPADWGMPAFSGEMPGVPTLPAAKPSAPFSPAAAAPPVVPPPAAALPPAPAAGAPEAGPKEKPKTLSFGKPKSFKVVPTIKSFRVVGPADAAAPPSAPPPVPTPAAPALPPVPTPPPAAALPPAPVVAPPAPTPAPLAPVPAASTPPSVGLPPAAASAPPEALRPVESPGLSIAPAASAPPVAPPPPTAPVQLPPAVESAPPSPLGAGNAPASFSLGATQPLTDFSTGSSRLADLASAPATAEAAPPPMTMAFSGAGSAAFSAATPAPVPVDMSPSTEAVIARLAKPAAAPVTAPPRAPRSNKPFLIAGGLLVLVLGVVGFLFLRQPKELKQMASLDDGQAPIGAPSLNEGQGAPPMVKPRSDAPARMAQAPDTPVTQPAPAPAPAPAAQSPTLDAAIAMVKDFPLDGGRGSVAQWLQYSYTANPDAGTEQWNASVTADKTYLVEYRLVPSAPGGNTVHYLFEADLERGFVLGKNLEAREMLAGGPPPEAPKAKPKPKPARKAPAKPAKRARRAGAEETKEVPLLPLPDSGELKPPAEDDGSFGANTVDSSM